MKNVFYNVLALCVFTLMSVGVSAQCTTEIQFDVYNGGVENWVSENSWENPEGSFWATSNPGSVVSSDNGNVFKDSDAHSGDYAARLETRQWFGQIASASLFSGDFELMILDPASSVQFGEPWNGERPEYFRYWYKFTSVASDSAECYVQLTVDGSNDVLVGEAYSKLKVSQGTWTEMVIPFDYFTGDTPDEITIVFASSANGDNFQGQPGNTLWIDDIELFSCNTGVFTPLMSEVNVKAFPNPTNESAINFTLSENINDGLIRVYSNDGREMSSQLFSGEKFEINLENWATGMYRFVIFDNESSSAISSGSFILE